MPNPKDPQKLQEYREKMSRIAKERGYGKWMLGKKLSEETCHKLSMKRKGKTYSEIYGEERAAEESEKRRIGNVGKIKHYSSPETKERLKSGLNRAGKTYSEIYGQEQAIVESDKRSIGHMKRWEGKERSGCRDKKNGESLYKSWRNSIFERDSYTCVECGKSSIEIHAHHIKEWAKYPEFRYDTDNGITLCIKCHSKKHPNNFALKAMANKKVEYAK